MNGTRDREGQGGPTADDSAVTGRMLDLLVVPAPSAALLGRVLAGRPPARVGWRELFGLVPAGAFVAAAVVGLWIGGAGLVVPPAFGASDDDWISQVVGDDVFDDGSDG